jgi:hypothetical protein
MKILLFRLFAAGDEQFCREFTLQATFSEKQKENLKQLLQKILGATKTLCAQRRLAWNFHADLSCPCI